MTTTSTDLRIFVGAESNPVEGCWVDPADFDTEAEVFAHLADKCPRWAQLVQYDPANQTCGGDWCIADYEGAKVSNIPEAIGLSKALAEVSGDDEDALLAYFENFSSIDIDALLDDFRDAYQGTFENVGAWAEDFEESTGTLRDLPDRFRMYIDFDAMGRDAEYGGDIWTADVPSGVAVFWNH